jgi:hypothetical protein
MLQAIREQKPIIHSLLTKAVIFHDKYVKFDDIFPCKGAVNLDPYEPKINFVQLPVYTSTPVQTTDTFKRRNEY